MIRLVYLGYYFKKLDWEKHNKFVQFASELTSKPKAVLFISSIFNSIKYNISILEYYQFRFFQKTRKEKRSYAGTGFMFEYQKKMNPSKFRKYFIDKRLFLETFSKLVRHQYASLDELRGNHPLAESILSNRSGKIVIKRNDGQCGVGVDVINATQLNPLSFVELMKNTGNDLAEEFIVQHPALMALSPSGLNTVRIFTQLTESGKVEIIGCRLRITINSIVDNLAAGNIAAAIDPVTGRLSGPGVYSDITKMNVLVHPITGIELSNFQVPFWSDILTLVEEAAQTVPECKSIGWDIAVTEYGPELLEGNHDWCKLVWQLPVEAGLKEILVKYL